MPNKPGAEINGRLEAFLKSNGPGDLEFQKNFKMGVREEIVLTLIHIKLYIHVNLLS